jgi:hypothetical protein
MVVALNLQLAILDLVEMADITEIRDTKEIVGITDTSFYLVLLITDNMVGLLGNWS